MTHGVAGRSPAAPVSSRRSALVGAAGLHLPGAARPLDCTVLHVSGRSRSASELLRTGTAIVCSLCDFFAPSVKRRPVRAPRPGYPRRDGAEAHRSEAPAVRPQPRRTLRRRRRRGRPRAAGGAARRRGRAARLRLPARPPRPAARAAERLEAGRRGDARRALPRGARVRRARLGARLPAGGDRPRRPAQVEPARAARGALGVSARRHLARRRLQARSDGPTASRDRRRRHEERGDRRRVDRRQGDA